MRRFSDQLLAFVCCVTGTVSVGHLFRVPVSRWSWLASLALLALIALRQTRHDPRPRASAVKAFVAPLGAALASAWIAGWFWDLSYDGQWYHQEAVLRLLRGWIPTRFSADLSIDSVRHWAEWWMLLEYPKAAWDYAAAWASLPFPFETSKGLGLLLGVSASFAVAAIVREGRPGSSRPLAFLVGAGAALSPVVVTQLWTFYTDGALASTLLLLAAGSFRAWRNPNSRECKVRVFASWILAANIKLSGFFLGLGILGMLAIALAATPSRRPALRGWVGSTVVAAALATLIFGAGSYLVNWVNLGNPFHPLRPGMFDRAFQKEIPSAYRGDGRLKSLGQSVVACATPDARQEGVRFARDWGLCEDPWSGFVVPDARTGGFGPFFPYALGIAAIGLMVLARRAPGPARTAFFLAAGNFVLVIINPHAWWARLAPHAYWLPWIPAIFFLRSRGQLERALGWVICAVLLANTTGALIANVRHQRAGTQVVQEELGALQGAGREIEIVFGPFRSFRHKLEERGIAYQERESTRDLSCENPIRFWWSPVEACIKPGPASM